MFWIFLLLFVGVIGAKYYTALGTRNLERRLNRVKADLDRARNKLRQERERQSGFSTQEEQAELRVRFMKELMQDLQVRLTESSRHADRQVDANDGITAAMRL